MPSLTSGASDRVFLFLQGPHGPFFSDLARSLRTAGAQVWRVGFNAGDQVFWHDKTSYIPYLNSADQWPGTFDALVQSRQVTDIILYGDTRPIHAQAIAIAQQKGITVHVFEEGYMRPWWVTYERSGSNGNSRLMTLDIAQMQRALDHGETQPPPPPSHWGDMRHHVFYGALYHWFVLFLNQNYRNFRRHRDLPVSTEFKLYFKRLMMMPFHRIQRRWATEKVRRTGLPYHLALLQLGHDSSVRSHSDFSCMSDFLEQVIEGFAKGAPAHHHLVIKEHPLENHREPLQRKTRQIAQANGISDRVHYVPGGKLARLLDDANSAVTINSTAGQQVLWRGIPLRIFGKAVYNKPEFVSHQPIAAFFANPAPPDREAFNVYRDFLLKTCQIPGGFYSRRGRRQLRRRAADMVLSPCDPYQHLLSGTEAATPQLKIVEESEAVAAGENDANRIA